MDIDDFEKLVNFSEGLISEGTLSQRDLSLFFFQSIRSQVNEIDYDKH